MSDNVLSKFPETCLPQIQTVRNSGFSGTALHKVYNSSYKPKIEKRKFIPVNHFITNNLNQLSQANDFGFLESPQQPQSPQHCLSQSPSMGVVGLKKHTHNIPNYDKKEVVTVTQVKIRSPKRPKKKKKKVETLKPV